MRVSLVYMCLRVCQNPVREKTCGHTRQAGGQSRVKRHCDSAWLACWCETMISTTLGSIRTGRPPLWKEFGLHHCAESLVGGPACCARRLTVLSSRHTSAYRLSLLRRSRGKDREMGPGRVHLEVEFDRERLQLEGITSPCHTILTLVESPPLRLNKLLLKSGWSLSVPYLEVRRTSGERERGLGESLHLLVPGAVRENRGWSSEITSCAKPWAVTVCGLRHVALHTREFPVSASALRNVRTGLCCTCLFASVHQPRPTENRLPYETKNGPILTQVNQFI